MSAALAIFVKTPGLSPVKTRLAAAIGVPAATRFHRLGAAAVAAVAKASGPAVTPYWALAEADPAATGAWPEFPAVHQGNGDLGARMGRVYAELLGRHGRALLVGADIPQITPWHLTRATALLADPAVAFVFGPASDGGFWLFGGSRPVPLEVWQSVRYSRPDTCDRLRRALPDPDAVATLPVLTDVDTADDLAVLQRELHHLPAPLAAQRAVADWLDITLQGGRYRLAQAVLANTK